MSSDKRIEFTKKNIDQYLQEVGKEYRRLVGKGIPAEIILVGGAAVLVNYGFRNMTTDVDAYIHAASGLKDAITIVSDRYDLPLGWMNSDFMNTESYSPRILEFSEYYRTFSNVLTVRTVSAEYLIAMKLRSGRQYKSDLSDIVGILAEHKRRNTPIEMKDIEKAVIDLYGSWDKLPESSDSFIRSVMKNGDYDKRFTEILDQEDDTRKMLVQFDQDYPQVVKGSNVDVIIQMLWDRKQSSQSEQE